MKLKFSVGAKVSVSGLDEDTGSVDGVKVSTLVNPGEIIVARMYPPHVSDENADPETASPHYLVKMSDDDGASHDVWFTEPRLSLA